MTDQDLKVIQMSPKIGFTLILLIVALFGVLSVRVVKRLVGKAQGHQAA